MTYNEQPVKTMMIGVYISKWLEEYTCRSKHHQAIMWYDTILYPENPGCDGRGYGRNKFMLVN